MTKLLHGDELVLSILEKELKVLTKKAEKAKADCHATMTSGSAIIAVREEAAKIFNAPISSYTKENLAKLDELAAKEKELIAISRRDIIKLMNAEHDTAFTRDELAGIIQNMKFRMGLRKGA